MQSEHGEANNFNRTALGENSRRTPPGEHPGKRLWANLLGEHPPSGQHQANTSLANSFRQRSPGEHPQANTPPGEHPSKNTLSRIPHTNKGNSANKANIPRRGRQTEQGQEDEHPQANIPSPDELPGEQGQQYLLANTPWRGERSQRRKRNIPRRIPRAQASAPRRATRTKRTR